MSPSTLILFFLFTFIQLLTPNLAQLEGCTRTTDYCWYCSNIGNYSDNSIYQKTLENLILSFSSTRKNNSGFYNVSSGQESEEVNAIGLCTGDLETESCKTCLNDTSRVILEHCPNQKEATSWALTCMVRYSNEIIFNTMQDKPMGYLTSPNNFREPNLFNRTLIPLLDNVTSRASSGDSLKKYASGQVSIPGLTIYAAGQCTPDLDKDDCSGCLDKGVSYIAQNFDGKQGARVLRPSCNLRYEIYKFFEPTSDHLILPASPTVSPPASPNSSKGKSNTSRTIVTAVIPSVTVVVLIIISVCIFLKLKRKPTEKLEKLTTLSEATEEISLAESLHFDLRTLRAATDNFSEENKLGQGGFGAVYKGRLDNGQYIAVKRLSKNSTQGHQEFKNEVMLVAKLQHRNLVRLRGFCLEEMERLLVYEYVPNSSLDQFIFDQTKRVELDWDKRYKIIQGIVRGLLYLHEDSRLRIIHRDLKASNILLDEEMNPKISDFGMARLFVIDQTQGNTSRIVGTYGYMAPEYFQGRFSVKSDIFSFGVLLLEIVSGEKNSCFKNGEEVEHLLTYAWKNWREGTASNLIDPTISVGSRTEIMRCIHIGLLCVQENVADRPTMNSVALMFNNQSATLAVPSKPAFFMDSSFGQEMSLASNNNSEATQSDNSKSDSVQRSINEASISDLYPR